MSDQNMPAIEIDGRHIIELEGRIWCDGATAAQIISKKSKRKVSPDTIRGLAVQQNKIPTTKVGTSRFYDLKVVKETIVEERGVKAVRANKARAAERRRQKALGKKPL